MVATYFLEKKYSVPFWREKNPNTKPVCSIVVWNTGIYEFFPLYSFEPAHIITPLLLCAYISTTPFGSAPVDWRTQTSLYKS